MNVERLGHDFPWRPWGPEVFAEARDTGRPILLHIGATWCHWCHVMDEGSYTYPGVAALIRDHFLAVRVDTDERPDVNERYNQGGWPTFAVLDAEGEVLMGRTYVPGPELRSMLHGLATSPQRWTIAPSPPRVRTGDRSSPEALWGEVTKAYDRYHGGFGDLEKFPHVAVCEWLLDRSLGGPYADEAQAMLERTLDAMAGRGMYDPEEGGFFRYATVDDWTQPHFEKLLEDHARLLALYLRAGVERPLWRRAVEAAIGWALRTLWQPDAEGFGGSQDADEAYYSRPMASRGTPPEVDRTVYAGWNGWMVVALVRASAVLDRPGLLGVARRVGLRVLLPSVAPDGRVTRVAGVTGLLDDQIGVAEGLLALYGGLGDDRWREAALRALTWAATQLRAPEGGFRDRMPEGPGRLATASRPMMGNAALALLAQRAGALTGDPAWDEVALSARDAALDEAADWGFMGAAAGLAAERLAMPAVVVKCAAAPALLREMLALPDATTFGVALIGEAAERAGVPTGSAMACSGRACGRPSTDREALLRTIRQLRSAR